MNIMVITTKIYNKFQTVIPKEIRKKLDITKDHLVEWYLDESGEVKIKFIENLSFEDMAGIFESDKPVDAVKLKKHVQRGNIDKMGNRDNRDNGDNRDKRGNISKKNKRGKK